MKESLKKIIPIEFRSIWGRYLLVSKTDYFKKNKVIGLFSLIKWTVHEWLNTDIFFKTPDGIRFVSMPKNFSSFMVSFVNYRDPNMQMFMERRLKNGSVFVDTGANIGTYTTRASILVGDQGKVVSVEAHPKTFEYLVKNIKLNNFKNVLPINIALGDKSGELNLTFDNSNAGETHVSGNGEEGFLVKVDTLDNLLSKNDIKRVDYLKIDVEGFEYPLLLGSKNTIENNKEIVVQIEIIDKHSKRYGRKAKNIVDFLSDLGLTPHIVDDSGSTSIITSFDFSLDYDVVWFRL